MKLNSPFHLQHLRLNLDRFSLLHPPGKILKNKIKCVNKRTYTIVSFFKAQKKSTIKILNEKLILY